MPNGEDWLQDPLRGIDNKFRELKSLSDEQNDLWQSFHFSTRLKLDGADHFCRQVLGAASRPFDLGLPLLADRQLRWYLDAFFFELMSAYDTLLQELNIVCDLGLKSKDVRWDTLKGKLPEKLGKYMEEEREEEWFEKVRKYRNMATHHSYLWTGRWKVTWGDKPWDYSEHGVSMFYLDDAGTLKHEEISACINHLKNMVKHIQQVWKEMAQEFD